MRARISRPEDGPLPGAQPRASGLEPALALGCGLLGGKGGRRSQRLNVTVSLRISKAATKTRPSGYGACWQFLCRQQVTGCLCRWAGLEWPAPFRRLPASPTGKVRGGTAGLAPVLGWGSRWTAVPEAALGAWPGPVLLHVAGAVPRAGSVSPEALSGEAVVFGTDLLGLGPGILQSAPCRPLRPHTLDGTRTTRRRPQFLDTTPTQHSACSPAGSRQQHRGRDLGPGACCA